MKHLDLGKEGQLSAPIEIPGAYQFEFELAGRLALRWVLIR